jgi:L,D-transpeptidase ErfK/SrfK
MLAITLTLVTAVPVVSVGDAGRLPAAVTGGVFWHVVRGGETIQGLGARFGVEPTVLARHNALDLKVVLRAGQTLEIDNRHIVAGQIETGLIINIPQRLLWHYAAGILRATYPVAVGRPDCRTPIGSFEVLIREENPTWDVPLSIQAEMARAGLRVVERVAPGPANPLGRYWLGLSLSGLGIHGTNAPASIYRFVTHGCIRLHPDDIAALYPAVATGASGRTMYEPVLMALLPDGRIQVEAHRDIYGLAPDAGHSLRMRAAAAGLSGLIDWTRADAVVREREGLARDVTAGPDGPVPGLSAPNGGSPR